MVKTVDKNLTLESSSSLLRFLKVMYFFGFLPFNWTKWISDEQQIRFKISRLKTLLVFFIDLLGAALIPTFIFVWYMLNIDGFDSGRLLTLKHYLDVNEGSATTALCQLTYIIYPCCIFWIYGAVGN